jgi:hypothetical protein
MDDRFPRRGRIVVVDGKLIGVQRRWMPISHSSLHIWFDSKFKTAPDRYCFLDYTGTRRMPGYITVDYARSGSGTTFESLRVALTTLDQIAAGRQAVAIFAHIGTSAISDRLLERFGWQRHASNLKGRHWIKRFS